MTFLATLKTFEITILTNIPSGSQKLCSGKVCLKSFTYYYFTGNYEFGFRFVLLG